MPWRGRHASEPTAECTARSAGSVSRAGIALSKRARSGLLVLLGLLAVWPAACSSRPAAHPDGTTAASAAATSLDTASGAASTRCPAPSPNTPGARESRLPLRSLCALPPEAAEVWHTIETGGRMDYPRDGIVFNNAEHILPARQRGYYHEYTVPTPGSRDRGARRLVSGQGHELYYTGDHYASFVVVDPTAAGAS
jgi:ribonuclease T1